MRYALAVTPKNWLLFGCHIVNFSAQSTQGYRFVNHWYMGGREKSLQEKAKEESSAVESGAEKLATDAKQGLNKAQEEVQKGIQKVKGQ